MEQITAFTPSLHRQKKHFSFSRFFTYFFSVVGMLISGYLFYRYYIISSNSIGKPDVCSAVFGKGCDTAINSNVSDQLGLPLAGWGFLYYFSILTISVAGAYFRQSFQTLAFTLLQLLTFLSCLVSLTLLGMMLIEPSLFCPLCLILHVINLLLFVSVVKMVNANQDQFFMNLRSETMAIFKKNGYETRHKRLLLTGILLSSGLLYTGLHLTAQKPLPQNIPFDAAGFLASYKVTPKKNIPIESDDPVLGSLSSPVEIITFSDFQCKSCRFFAKVITALNKKYPDKIHVVFKHFPLGMACNNALSTDEHPRACEIAWASEAARVQGKFWEFHDLAFKIDLTKGNTVCNIADSVGLDHKLFETYRSGKEAQLKTNRTIQLARSLGVDATPYVFVNGKSVSDFRFIPMVTLMDYLLANSTQTSNNVK